MTDRLETVLRITRDPKLADDWALVLVTQGLSPSLTVTEDGIAVSVREEDAERALAGLSAYEQENPMPARQEDHKSHELPTLIPGLVIAAVLLTCHGVTIQWNNAALWYERGSADAGRILEGEVWRAVTALTLHADLAHVLSNAAAAAVFVSALSSMTGAGMAFALFIVAGTGGNLVNAFFQGPPHVVVGASTAIFGAVGILGGIGLVKRRRQSSSRRGAWMPLAAALALLAMLGTGTGRVDVLAHLFGFLVGAVLGVLCAVMTPGRPMLPSQWICGGAAAVLLISCWMLALS